jgi:hypothetical protein
MCVCLHFLCVCVCVCAYIYNYPIKSLFVLYENYYIIYLLLISLFILKCVKVKSVTLREDTDSDYVLEEGAGKNI